MRTGGGDDTITVGDSGRGLDDILAVVNVDGPAGTNTLLIDNRGAANKQLTVTRTSVKRNDGKVVDFAKIKFLKVQTDGGAGNVNVQEKAAGVDIEVGLQGGNNNVGAGNLGFELGGGPNWVTVTSGLATDHVTVGGNLGLTVLPDLGDGAQSFTLVDNRTTTPIVGTFNGLPEGAVIPIGDRDYTITYIAGTNNNDVVISTPARPPAGEDDASVSGTVLAEQNGNVVGAAGVAVNLIDANGNALQAVADALGAYLFPYLAAGTYQLLFNYSFSYGPFTLTAAQSLTNINATLIPQSPPVAVADTASTNEDTSVTIGVLANDTDPNGDTLTVVDATYGTNGTTTVNADNTITYTPRANWSGTDTFTYLIDDGFGGTSAATVTVTVAAVVDAPVARDEFAMAPADAPADIDLWALVTDVEAAPAALTFAVTSAQNGTAMLLADGHTVRFTPAPGYHGPAAFTYTATDPGTALTTAPATVTVSVNAPPTASDVTVTVPNGGPAVIPVTGSDPDGDPLSVTAVTQPATGGVSINGSGQVVYLPPAGFTGTTAFTFTIGDGHGGTATATVTVTVTAGGIVIDVDAL